MFNAPCLGNLKRDEDISLSENGTEDKVELGAVRSVQSAESRRRAPADCDAQ